MLCLLHQMLRCQSFVNVFDLGSSSESELGFKHYQQKLLKIGPSPNLQKLNVKVIAFDLDDTLLNHDLKISPKTVSAIQKAAEKGIYIVLCSGRAENAILPYVADFVIKG